MNDYDKMSEAQLEKAAHDGDPVALATLRTRRRTLRGTEKLGAKLHYFVQVPRHASVDHSADSMDDKGKLPKTMWKTA